MSDLQTRYLERLAELYPTIAAASTEEINLEAILNLPKGTEHFLTDIHGEYEAFSPCAAKRIRPCGARSTMCSATP